MSISKQKIPEGWCEIPVGEVFDFVKSYAFSRDNLIDNTSNDERIGNIHYGDIHSTFSSPSINLKKVSVPMIKDKNFTPKVDELLKDGDLIMADVSEDYEGIGVTVSLHGLSNKKLVGGLHTFVLRDNKKKTDEYFRQYIFRNHVIRRSLQKIANGVSVYGISKSALSKLLLPLPSLPEQKRIVSVLETWDKYLEVLDRKIKTKKSIRKSLMQQLLTGKKRLKGFSDGWKMFKLGGICNITTGKKDVNQGNPNGLYPFFTCAKEKTFSDSYSFDKEAILIAGNGEVGNCLYYKGKFEAYQRTYVLSEFKFDTFYIFSYLKSFFQNSIESQKQMGAMPYIKLGMLKDFEITLPSLEAEQMEIAKILSKADDEIDELDKKRSIILAQKKYLLNNLITGTIRFPEFRKN